MERNNSITSGYESARNQGNFGISSNTDANDYCEDCYMRNRKMMFYSCLIYLKKFFFSKTNLKIHSKKNLIFCLFIFSNFKFSESIYF